MKEALQRVRENKSVVGILLMEFVLVILFLYSLTQIVLLNFDTRTVSYNFAPENFFLTGLSAFTFIAIYFILRKREHKAYHVQVQAGKTFKEAVKRKLGNAKEDPRVAALILIEFMIGFFMAYAVAAYLDPELTFINWDRLNLHAPVTWALNVIIFAIMLAVFLKIYSYTSDYRSKK